MTKWIQKAIKKPGALHSQLGMPMDKKIGSAIMTKIMKAHIGDMIKIGNKSIKVTALLKKRASLGKTLVKVSKNK